MVRGNNKKGKNVIVKKAAAAGTSVAASVNVKKETGPHGKGQGQKAQVNGQKAPVNGQDNGQNTKKKVGEEQSKTKTTEVWSSLPPTKVKRRPTTSSECGEFGSESLSNEDFICLHCHLLRNMVDETLQNLRGVTFNTNTRYVGALLPLGTTRHPLLFLFFKKVY